MYNAGQQVKIVARPNRLRAQINKMAAQLELLETTIFQVCVQIKNVKEKKNTQQATEYAAETV
jgi:hypothetical protein